MFRILCDPSSGSVERAGLKLLVIFLCASSVFGSVIFWTYGVCAWCVAPESGIRPWMCLLQPGFFFTSTHSQCRSQWPRDLRRKVFGRSPAEIVGSNATGGMDVCLFECCQVEVSATD